MVKKIITEEYPHCGIILIRGGSMFVDKWHLTGSWGCNFIGNEVYSWHI